MKKNILLLTILFLAFTRESKAQRLFFLFGHAEYASTSGKINDTHNNGLGIEAGAGIGMSKTFFTGTIGYTWLQNRNTAAGNALGDVRYSPIKFGVRHYVFRRNLFVKGDAGIATMKPEHAGSQTNFTAGVGAGIKFTKFEALAEYTTVSKWGSWLSIKAGLTFSI